MSVSLPTALGSIHEREREIVKSRSRDRERDMRCDCVFKVTAPVDP